LCLLSYSCLSNLPRNLHSHNIITTCRVDNREIICVTCVDVTPYSNQHAHDCHCSIITLARHQVCNQCSMTILVATLSPPSQSPWCAKGHQHSRVPSLRSLVIVHFQPNFTLIYTCQTLLLFKFFYFLICESILSHFCLHNTTNITCFIYHIYFHVFNRFWQLVVNQMKQNKYLWLPSNNNRIC
jgi:hypothetical protein